MSYNGICYVICRLQVNALDGLGQTALHRVAQQGNMQACRLLMSYGVNASLVSLQGYTAAQLATENIQKMLKGKTIESRNVAGIFNRQMLVR